MAKQKGTAEHLLKPGDRRNLNIAFWGDVGADEYLEQRNLFLRWKGIPELLELIDKKPFHKHVPRYKKAIRDLEKDTAKFIKEAILEGKPEKLQKLALIIERFKQDAASPDVAAVLIYVWQEQWKYDQRQKPFLQQKLEQELKKKLGEYQKETSDLPRIFRFEEFKDFEKKYKKLRIFTFQEIRDVVAKVKGFSPLDVKANEALDLRTKRIARKIGLHLKLRQ